MLRRQFLNAIGLSVGASIIAPSSLLASSSSNNALNLPIKAGDWTALRNLFPLTRSYIQLATFLLASHPKPVADAIEKHRRAFDVNPADY